MAEGAGPTEAVTTLLRRVELAVDRRLDGLLQGDYQGLVPGHGSEAGEARSYVPGDDVRRIDWTVTARTADTHVRDTIADHELELTVVIDRSGSTRTGTRRTTRDRLAVEIAAALGFVVAVGGNRTGYLTAADGETTWIPRRRGRAHVRAAAQRLAAVEPSGPADLAGALRTAARLAERRGAVAVISDLREPIAEWQPGLRRLSARHDVLVVELTDPLDRELPDVGLLTVVDAESGRRRRVDTARASLRERYAAAASEAAEGRAAAVRAAGGHHLALDTAGDWVADLVAHLDRRRRFRPRQRVTR